MEAAAVWRPPARWTDDLKRVAGSDWMAKTGDRVLWRTLGEAYVLLVNCTKRMMMMMMMMSDQTRLRTEWWMRERILPYGITTAHLQWLSRKLHSFIYVNIKIPCKDKVVEHAVRFKSVESDKHPRYKNNSLRATRFLGRSSFIACCERGIDRKKLRPKVETTLFAIVLSRVAYPWFSVCLSLSLIESKPVIFFGFAFLCYYYYFTIFLLILFF